MTFKRTKRYTETINILTALLPYAETEPTRNKSSRKDFPNGNVLHRYMVLREQTK